VNIKKHAHDKSLLLACSFVGIRKLSCVAMRRSKLKSMPITKACLLVRLSVFVGFPALLCGLASLSHNSCNIAISSN